MTGLLVIAHNILYVCFLWQVETAPTVGSVTTSDETKRRLAIQSWYFNLNDSTFCKMFPELAKVSFKSFFCSTKLTNVASRLGSVLQLRDSNDCFKRR